MGPWKKGVGTRGIMPPNGLPPFNFLWQYVLALISTSLPLDWQIIMVTASTSHRAGVFVSHPAPVKLPVHLSFSFSTLSDFIHFHSGPHLPILAFRVTLFKSWMSFCILPLQSTVTGFSQASNWFCVWGSMHEAARTASKLCSVFNSALVFL